ncbi:MAG: YfbK domain-containing protein [Limisphaerales bacterium]
MNPELPPNPRAELEAKVTALLLGELSAEEAASVRDMIAKDAELGRLRDRLSLTLDLLRETAATPIGETPAQRAPLKLSPARREKLLAHFKTVRPKEFASPSRRKTSWLVPLAAAAAFAALLTVVIVPNFVKARTASYKNSVVNNLRLLDSAKQQWALEQRKSSTDVPTLKDLKPYFGRGFAGDRIEGSKERYFIGPVERPPVAVVDAAGGKKTIITLPGTEGDGNLAALNKPAPVAAAPLQGATSAAAKFTPPAALPSLPPPQPTQIVLPQSGQPELAQAERRENEQISQLSEGKAVPILGDVPTLGTLFGGGHGLASRRENKKTPPTTATAPAEPGLVSSTVDLSDVRKDKRPSESTLRLALVEQSANRTLKVEPLGEVGGQRGSVPESVFAGIAGPPAAAAPVVTVPTHVEKDKEFSYGEKQRWSVSASVQPPPGFPPRAQAATVSTVGGVVVAGAGLIADVDAPLSRTVLPAPVPQPEVATRDNAFTTFSLNVSDVAFKLAAASLQNGAMPDAASMRSEEFINAFDYRDPEPAPGAPIGFAWERAADPFAQNRDLLRFSIKTAAQGREAGRPLNLVLLLDKSGSMERADRVEIVSQALRVLATQLQPQDTLSVVVFARTARLWVDGVPGSQAGAVANDLRSLTPEGGTNLEEAMRLAYATALRHYLANGENRVVLLTDGAANLGNVDPKALQQNVETNRKQGISFDCFGVGWDGYNDELLETLSRAGNGRYAFINTPEEAATEFAGKLAGALHVAAADVKVQVEFNPNRVTSYRQIGYAKYLLAKEQFRDNSVTAAQIGAAESGNALYTVEINPAGDGPLGTVHVGFRLPGTSDYQEHEWTVPFAGSAPPLEKASSAMCLAATAAAFSEWLAGSPYAGEVTPERLLVYLSGVPQAYGADARPAKLEWMIRQAKSISGK